MTAAFVLSNGGSLGAIRVGRLRAILEAGITPELIVGSSAAAVNGGWLAGRPDREGVLALAKVWQGLSRAEVFPARPLLGRSGVLGRRQNVVPTAACAVS